MLTVMLIDDEPLIRLGLQKLIDWEKLGWQVIAQAEDGEAALEFLHEHSVDLVITDLMMPGMDGIELSKEINKTFTATNVIVLTGYDDFEYIQKSLRNQVLDYLLKPIDAELLIETLIRVKEIKQENNIPFPYELESKLKCALENNDLPAVEDLIRDLFVFFKRYNTPDSQVRQIWQSIRFGQECYFKERGHVINHIYPDIPGGISAADMQCLLDHTMQTILLTLHEHNENALIRQIKSYVEERLEEDLSLTCLAKTFYVNISYLSNLFKEETGMNYSDYIAGIRIREAAKLMRNTKYSIGEIGEKVGYPDQRYFSQFFKKHTGITPSVYKQMRT
ncbi:response regulator [Paenibacillus swuensis]|uniref:response regulator n=1 Tax=Paenibacillus swuensis TaxID=1178515 RepID=UPI0008396ACD|nr:response regulator [Paenibacillus swuensis]